MKAWLAILVALALSGCDRTSGLQTGSVRDIRLQTTARRLLTTPDSLRLTVRINGCEALQLVSALGSGNQADLDVEFAAHVEIHARLFSAGDTTQICDTSFAMPELVDLKLILMMRAVLSTGPTLSPRPRTQATVGLPFLDTLILNGPGAATTILSIVAAPTGLTLVENRIRWVPSDTGHFTIKIGFNQLGRLDTLGWQITVGKATSTIPAQQHIGSAGLPFLYGSGLDSGIAPTTVRLSHDFDIDPIEITQKLYDSLMSKYYPGYTKPAWTEPKGSSMPAYLVSFNNAVLFCNARSRAANLDTVFQYTNLTWRQGAASIMAIKVRRNVRGYRLPTEAEWDFAARGGSDSLPFWKNYGAVTAASYANYPVGGIPQPLLLGGKRLSNGYGLYDMFGNLNELVLAIYHSGTFRPDELDPWGPGIWDWGGLMPTYWGGLMHVVLRGGSNQSSVERSWCSPVDLDPHVGFRTVLPVGTGGQGSIRPGIIPSLDRVGDSTFFVRVGNSLSVSFLAWDLFGDVMTISIKGTSGPTVYKNSIVTWVPALKDVGEHVFQVIARASDARVSEPFPMKITVWKDSLFPTGMVKVPAAGQVVSMGNYSVKLRGDYLMFAQENAAFSTGTSWQGAVQFANQLSRKYGLDSAYAFTFPAGYVRRANANGFRLPTEAEWVFAALGGGHGPLPLGCPSLDACAWDSLNAKALHSPGLKAPNSFGLYDILGNSREWVESHEILGWVTPGSTIADTLTTRGANRLRKGGSWSSPMKTLELWDRSDFAPETVGTGTASTVRLILPYP